MSSTTKIVSNGHGLSTQTADEANGDFPCRKTKIKPLPEKQFEIRESLLTELFENPHIKSVQHLFIASLIGLMVNSVAHDYYKGKEIHIGFSLIKNGFGRIHIVALVWTSLNIVCVICYYYFKLWAKIRVSLKPKKKVVNLLDYSSILILVAYYVFSCHFLIPSIITYFKLPVGSSSILLIEQIRLLMKVHSFVRSNAPKVLNYKPHSDQELNIAKLSHFVYFLFAPTLVYRDKYPRTKTIRWNFVFYRLLEIVGVLFYYAFITDKFLIRPFQHAGLRPFPISEVLLMLSETAAAGLMCMLLAFYCVLHSTQNLLGELLRFGDRMFYKNWWTCTNYPEYFRTWNVVVHDWLYTYIYKDIYEILAPGNKLLARLAVFGASAIVHEWILCHMLGFFFPALFFCFLFTGYFIGPIRAPKTAIANILFWFSISAGAGLLVGLYSMEYFVRENLPLAPENTSLVTMWIPRIISCNCIG